MAFEFENLFLDDNTFTTVPEGDYHFKVDGYSVEYSTSTKMPENTQVIRVEMSVPCMIEGKREVASVNLNLNVYSKAMFAIRQFFECIGLLPEKGKQKFPNPDLMIGKSGICHLIAGVSAKGNEYNQVDQCYPPSKAPRVCANDDAWNMPDINVPVEEDDENPFL